MSDFVNRTTASTSVLIEPDGAAFTRGATYIRQWLSRRLDEFDLEPRIGVALEQRQNDAARLIVRSADDALSFAFAHEDERDRDVQLDVEVMAEGARPPLAVLPLSTSPVYAPERMAALYFYSSPGRNVTVIASGPRKLPTPADGT